MNSACFHLTVSSTNRTVLHKNRTVLHKGRTAFGVFRTAFSLNAVLSVLALSTAVLDVDVMPVGLEVR
jgi:hypothetical protein